MLILCKLFLAFFFFFFKSNARKKENEKITKNINDNGDSILRIDEIELNK
jgi:hypothetical protein